MGIESRLNDMRNKSVSALALAAAAAGTVPGAAMGPNFSGRGLVLAVDITAITGSLTVNIYGDDPVSGKKYLILASAALAAAGTTILRVYPGLVAAANLTANDVLPTNWHVEAVIVTGPVTATIGGHVIE